MPLEEEVTYCAFNIEKSLSTSSKLGCLPFWHVKVWVVYAEENKYEILLSSWDTDLTAYDNLGINKVTICIHIHITIHV